ncbi:MAG: hypothetical protein KU38_10710 [Sulfurovum sp. FS08-3]|nr:MAG: hypothetical protein KU38_10710 [Sulfurovum sp. FS08-3]
MKLRYAFSMIELVFVIVVMGILASLAIPRMDRDLRQEAMDSIMSDIMLAQRMAVSDFRHDAADPKWQKTYWKWRITECSNDTIFYIVTSNKDDRTNADRNESAIDPYNQKYLYAQTTGYCSTGNAHPDDSDRVLITKKFGIKSIDRKGGCSSAQHIAFDEFGRPHNGIDSYTKPNFAYLMKEDCELTFNFENGLIEDSSPFTITVEAITGRTFVSKR